MSLLEHATRKLLIDKALAEAGWTPIIPHDPRAFCDLVALADIISIIRHAARGEPLLSAEERVNRAVARACAAKVWTMGQEKWLDLIRNHLVENLAIDREDFDQPLKCQVVSWRYQVGKTDADSRLEVTLSSSTSLSTSSPCSSPAGGRRWCCL